MGRMGVTTADLRKVHGLLDPTRPCRPHRPDRLDDQVPQSFLADVMALIGCDDCSFVLMDTARRWGDFQGIPDIPDEWDDETEELCWQGYFESLAVNYPQQTGDHRTVGRLSDFHSQRDLTHMRLKAWMGRVAVRHFVSVPVPAIDALDRRLVLYRSDGSDFSERDVLLLTLLRPYLVEMHLRRVRELRGQPELSSRQWDMLRLLGTGCTNRQAARALGISEATVAKHLENAYAKLGVNSRTEALARVTLLERDAHTVVS
ncbi:MAG TPA: LuxR C-terminal-related transcriptional regulator [Segeticoccus sp.]|uniref:helix-turn-helix transcriptional regulator n=1 Tax=Segeticoccus sp. TaxID=2706531 RepID=UPI002D7F9480|nr:LuxR C-terminal-related transcriptional regulator [Segeticoccus sp.]HET8602112.1 LuxR C-terminal-related transcriptional regulator [Segeticoccus sp.]